MEDRIHPVEHLIPVKTEVGIPSNKKGKGEEEAHKGADAVKGRFILSRGELLDIEFLQRRAAETQPLEVFQQVPDVGQYIKQRHSQGNEKQ